MHRSRGRKALCFRNPRRKSKTLVRCSHRPNRPNRPDRRPRRPDARVWVCGALQRSSRLAGNTSSDCQARLLERFLQVQGKVGFQIQHCCTVRYAYMPTVHRRRRLHHEFAEDGLSVHLPTCRSGAPRSTAVSFSFLAWSGLPSQPSCPRRHSTGRPQPVNGTFPSHPQSQSEQTASLAVAVDIGCSWQLQSCRVSLGADQVRTFGLQWALDVRSFKTICRT